MFRRIISILALLLTFMMQHSAFAKGNPIQSLDRLPESRYMDLIEDYNGYMWIATMHGLARYDGYNYFLFNHIEGNPETLLDNHVTSLANNGETLWVGTHKGLQYLSTGYKSFGTVMFPNDREVHVNSLLSLKDGRILVSTSNQGLYMVSPNEDNMATDFRLSPNVGPEELESSNALCQDSSGYVWIGTGHGVYFHNLTTGQTIPYAEDIISDPVIGIAAGNGDDGLVYVATHDALFVVNHEENSVIRVVPEISRFKLQRLFKDRHGHVFLASTGNWLLEYDRERKVLVREKSLSNDVNITSMEIEAFYQDRNDNIWLGIAYSDLVMIKADRTILNPIDLDMWVNVTPGVVSGMVMGDDGRLWVGYNNRGIMTVDSAGYLNEISQDWYVNDLIVGKDGLIWSCSNDGRIGYYDDSIGRVRTVRSGLNYKLLNLAQDNQERIYALGLYHGLIRFANSDSDGMEELPIPKDNSDNIDYHLFYTMDIDSRNCLWIGGVEGLRCFDIDSEKMVEINERLRNLRCLEIKADSRGRIWIRTYETVVMYSPEDNRIDEYGHTDENEVFVLQFSEDGSGNMWTGSRINLVRINPEEKRIDKVIGIDANKVYSYASAYNVRKNILYTGGNGDLRQFSIEDQSIFPKLGDVCVTGLYLRGELIRSTTLSGNRPVSEKSLTVSDTFNFGYDDNTVQLKFSTLNYGNEPNISYEYKLDDRDWISTIQGSNVILLARMSQGSHALTVRAKMNDMYSNEKHLNIVIRAPWYGSVLAMVIYIILVIIVVAFMSSYQYRVYQHNLSDRTLDSFTNVAHEMCNPLSMVISPIEDLMKSPNMSTDEKNQLIQIRRNAARVQNTANQLIDVRKYRDSNIKPKFVKTEMVSFMLGLIELYTGEAARRRIEFSFVHSKEEIYLWVDRESVDRIVTNLLSNAFKFTPDGGTIEIKIDTGESLLLNKAFRQYVDITVTDSGPGIDEKQMGRIFDRFFTDRKKSISEFSGHGIGLHLCKVLAMRLHGQIKFQNRTDVSGAVVTLSLPQGCDHLDSSEIITESEADRRLGLDMVKFELESHITDDQKIGVGRNIRVMVIDDDESMLDFLENNLKHNYWLIKIKDSVNVIKEVIARKPDVVVTDLMMPQVNGEEVVRAIKKNTLTSHIPVIILSGKTNLEDRMKGIESGADYYMTKPFYISELKSVINTLVNNRLIVKGKFSGQLEQEDSIKAVEFKSSDELFMEKVISIINKNLSNPDFSVEDVQNGVGLGRTQLFRKLKEMTGFPPARFIQNFRMKQAYNLLKEKKMDVSQIAYAVGFSSQTHFSTLFKQYYGVSPTELINETKDIDDGTAHADNGGENSES